MALKLRVFLCFNLSVSLGLLDAEKLALTLPFSVIFPDIGFRISFNSNFFTLTDCYRKTEDGQRPQEDY